MPTFTWGYDQLHLNLERWTPWVAYQRADDLDVDLVVTLSKYPGDEAAAVLSRSVDLMTCQVAVAYSTCEIAAAAEPFQVSVVEG